MTILRLMLAAVLTLTLAFPALGADEARPAKKARRKAQVAVENDIPADQPVRTTRPATISASGVGKTPYIGALVDMNLHPNVALGLGYGYFAVDTITGSFIPVYGMIYALQSSFSPFLEGGVDFVTVNFQSANTLLNSTFRGTQYIVGAGLEYRFDFGVTARLDAVRFLNAHIWSPGLAIGYSVVVF